MDVHCCRCREPWDQDYLIHELNPFSPAELLSDGWVFGRNRLVILHCPSCRENGHPLPDAEERAAAVQTIAELLGDDLDGLASTLDDLGL